MVLKRDVIILIYYMSNGLIFEILNGFYEIFRDIGILLKNDFYKIWKWKWSCMIKPAVYEHAAISTPTRQSQRNFSQGGDALRAPS